MEGDDYIGHCVNVASRLCDLAPSSEAWAAPAVMEDLPSWGVAARETSVSLRGVEKPVPASSIRMAFAGEDGGRDPICGLPLSHDTAEEIAHDVRGSVVLFCSAGCIDTWRRRPSTNRAGATAAD
jgi:YHS domain-containing protein